MLSKIALIIALVVALGSSVFYFLPSSMRQTSAPVTTTQESVLSLPGYRGRVIAGKDSPYIEYNTADYEKAKAENKIILLEFYANWCPICRAQEPDFIRGFNSLKRSDLIGFRVNYNDGDTDDGEKVLADKHKIVYQHTRVILKEGVEVLRSNEQWDAQMLLSEIAKL